MAWRRGGNGEIVNSYATGNVSAGDTSIVGGLTALIPITFSLCGGCVGSDGYAYLNAALVSNSYATGNVIVGAGSVTGGLVGLNFGSVSQSYATGVVSGSGSFNDLGGLVGVNNGSVTQSYATRRGERERQF